MKLFAQHGFGPGEKIKYGIKEKTIDGVIFSARYEKIDKIIVDTKEILSISPNTEIFLDPEIYACFFANLPDVQIGSLNEWPFFKALRRSQLEDTSAIENILSDTYLTLKEIPITSFIAPNIFIPKSFDSIEAVIAKNFLRKTKPIFKKVKDKRRVYATLAIGRDAFLNKTEFEAFLNDITALDDPPDGFYILIGAGLTEGRTELTHSEIIHADVIAGWMLLNYTLSLNGYTVINGFSDILSPFLGVVGGYAGATGWWSNLRMFSLNRYIRSISGGRLPTVRYLSNLLLNRITFSQREAIAKLLPEINNGYLHDQDYEQGEPARNIEVLQTWEAISNLNKQLVEPDIYKSLQLLENAISKADNAYTKLSSFGIHFDIETNREYLNALREGIKTFREIAEIAKP